MKFSNLDMGNFILVAFDGDIRQIFLNSASIVQKAL